MGEVLAIKYLWRGFAGVEDEARAAVPTAMRANGGKVSAELKTLRSEAVLGLESRENGCVILPKGFHDPPDGAELVGVGLTVAHESLSQTRSGADPGKAGQ